MEGPWQAPYGRLYSQKYGLPVSQSPWHLDGGWLARSTQQVHGICMGQGAWGIPASKSFATPNAQPTHPPKENTACIFFKTARLTLSERLEQKPRSRITDSLLQLSHQLLSTPATTLLTAVRDIAALHWLRKGLMAAVPCG